MNFIVYVLFYLSEEGNVLMKKSRSVFIAELNQSELTPSIFYKYDKYNNYKKDVSLKAYLVGYVYNTYYWLFHQQDYFRKHKKFNYRLSRNKLSLKKPFGTATYANLITFVQFCEINKINPVYYISVIFSAEVYRVQELLKSPRLTSVRKLPEFYYRYKKHLEYENKAYTSQDGRSHQTVKFLNNYLIRVFNWLFETGFSLVKNKKQLQLQLQEQANIYDSSIIDTAFVKQTSLSDFEKRASLAFLNYSVQYPHDDLLSTFTAQLWGINQLPLFYFLNTEFLKINYAFFKEQELLKNCQLTYDFFFGNVNMQVKKVKRQTITTKQLSEVINKNWITFIDMQKLVDLLLQHVLPKETETVKLKKWLRDDTGKFVLSKLVKYYGCTEEVLENKL